MGGRAIWIVERFGNRADRKPYITADQVIEWWADIEADFWRFFPLVVERFGMMGIPWRLFQVLLRGLPGESSFAHRVEDYREKHDWRRQLDRATGRKPGESRGAMSLDDLAREFNAPRVKHPR